MCPNPEFDDSLIKQLKELSFQSYELYKDNYYNIYKMFFN